MQQITTQQIFDEENEDEGALGARISEEHELSAFPNAHTNIPFSSLSSGGAALILFCTKEFNFVDAMIPRHSVRLYPCYYIFLELRRQLGRIEVDDNIEVQHQNDRMLAVKIEM